MDEFVVHVASFPAPFRSAIGVFTYPAWGLRENRGMAASLPPLVGRSAEREAAAALEALRARRGEIVAIEGEPGIGKSRLLAHLEAGAAAEGFTVLAGRASEFEADLPNALWTEALDRHLAEAGERRLLRLGLDDPAALSMALPALSVLGGEPAQGDRHRTHRALQDLLVCLAASRPLVLCLDDVHWADSASADALAALVRRPAAAGVLLAVATRAGGLPDSVASALLAAVREGRLTRLVPAPLSEREAAELVGEAAAAIYAQCVGNPFYLEQLARASHGARVEPGIAADRSVPSALAAALADELAALTPDARRLLDGAAVAGDPFEVGLAAELAELSEAAGLAALDELLACALARPAGAPRLFAFRHPVVRHAVYEAAPSVWRLGAHARAAGALERSGAGPVERAHHVEQAARPGDAEAIELLATAASDLQFPAPAVAARFYAATLRLLPDRPENREQHVYLTPVAPAPGNARADRVRAGRSRAHPRHQRRRRGPPESAQSANHRSTEPLVVRGEDTVKDGPCPDGVCQLELADGVFRGTPVGTGAYNVAVELRVAELFPERRGRPLRTDRRAHRARRRFRRPPGPRALGRLVPRRRRRRHRRFLHGHRQLRRQARHGRVCEGQGIRAGELLRGRLGP
jgi:hypothetical protein